MIGLGIGVAWTFGKINRFVSNMILAFRTRVAAGGGVFEAPTCLAAQLEELRKDQLLSSTSLVVTPNAYKAGILYDIVPNTALGDLDVVRATSATRVDANGLIEIPRTNLLTYSEQFDNAIWTKTGSTITANSTTAPNGTLTADTINISVQDVERVIQRVLTGVSITGITYRASIWVKGQGTNIGKLVRFRVKRNSGGSLSDAIINHTLTSDWVRISIGFTGIADNTGVSFGFDGATGYADSFDVWGAQLEQGVSATEYIPTVASIRTKFAGITQDGSSASNIPRLDYTNGSCPSILVEPQRTNLALRSEEFNVSPWTTLGTTTITPNATTAPDGNLTADLILGVDSTSNVNQIIAGTIGVVYTNSFYIKNNNSTQSQVLIRNSTSVVAANINWSGSILTSIINNAGTTTFQDAGNGWYRIISTYTAVEATQRPRVYPTLNTNQSVYVWGAQLEVGANATSYIPTTSASVTRNADVISKTGISSLIGQSEGTIYFEADIQKHNQSEFYIAISNGSSLGEAIYFQQPSSGALNILFRTSGLTPTIVISSANWNVGYNKIAIAYNSTLGEVFINGVSKGTVALSALPTCSQLTLGARPDNPGNLVGSGGYKIASLFKTRLTNTELAQLTTI